MSNILLRGKGSKTLQDHRDLHLLQRQ
jgi:hypothetical protein